MILEAGFEVEVQLRKVNKRCLGGQKLKWVLELCISSQCSSLLDLLS